MILATTKMRHRERDQKLRLPAISTYRTKSALFLTYVGLTRAILFVLCEGKVTYVHCWEVCSHEEVLQVRLQIEIGS